MRMWTIQAGSSVALGCIGRTVQSATLPLMSAIVLHVGGDLAADLVSVR